MYIHIYIISGVQEQKNKRKLYISQLQLSRMFTSSGFFYSLE